MHDKTDRAPQALRGVTYAMQHPVDDPRNQGGNLHHAR